MSEPEHHPHGTLCWVDHGSDDAPERAVVFYRDLFGWEVTDAMPAPAPGHY